MNKRWLIGIATLMLGSQGAWAQGLPEYTSTGMIDLTIQGKSTTFHTTSNTIPNQPGKVIQTANWRTFSPMILGGVNIAPPGILVSLWSRPTVEPSPRSPEFKFTFSLDENSFTLLESAPVEARYFVHEDSQKKTYEYVSGTLSIQSVKPIGDDILEVSGRAAGVLSARNGKKNTVPELNYEANFVVQAHRH